MKRLFLSLLAGLLLVTGVSPQELPTPSTPTWIVRNDAAVDLDFARQRYFGAPSLDNILVTTRASDGYAQTLAGTLVNFGPNVPRITDRGLLVEESRINLINRSQEFQHTGVWTATETTVVADDVAAPDGTTTADKLVESATASAYHELSSAQITKTTAALNYSFTVYVKDNGRRLGVFATEGAGANGVGIMFDVAGAQVGVAGAAYGSGWVSGVSSVETLANGWVRVRYSFTSNSAANIWVGLYLDNATGTSAESNTYTGNGTSGVYLFGAQLEQSTVNFPTSYIPTAGSAATRSGELHLLQKAFARNWMSGSGGWVYCEVGGTPMPSDRTGVILYLSATNLPLRVRTLGTGPTEFTSRANDLVNITTIGGGGTIAGAMKGAVSWNGPLAGGSLTVVANNGTPTTSQVSFSANVSATTAVFPLGSGAALENSYNGYIKRLAIGRPGRKLTGDELKAMTVM